MNVCIVTLVWSFLLVWPWPLPDDLGLRTWRRYPEDVCAYWNLVSMSVLSKVRARTGQTDAQTDRRDRTHYRCNVLHCSQCRAWLSPPAAWRREMPRDRPRYCVPVFHRPVQRCNHVCCQQVASSTSRPDHAADDINADCIAECMAMLIA